MADNSLKRHLRYCRKKTAISKTRTKSCEACIRAKTRCDPGLAGCERCLEKGQSCSFLSSNIPGDHVAISGSMDLSKELQGSMELPVQDARFGSFPFDSFIPGSDSIIVDAPQNTIFSNDADISVSGFSNLPKLFEPKAFHSVSRVMASTAGAGILRSYPSLMREERTFPPFIHRSYGLDAIDKVPPLALRNAKSIAQSFINDSPDTLFKIRQEQRRIISDSDGMEIEDLIASCQALIIYLLMRIIIGPSDDQEDIQLIRDLWHVTHQIIKASKGLGAIYQHSQWKYWALIESKRRMSITIRLIRQLYNIDIGLIFPYEDITTATPLPANKLLWLAKDETEWKKELKSDEYYADLSMSDLVNFKGSTVDDCPSGEEWARWYAGADELGILVVISMTLL